MSVTTTVHAPAGFDLAAIKLGRFVTVVELPGPIVCLPTIPFSQLTDDTKGKIFTASLAGASLLVPTDEGSGPMFQVSGILCFWLIAVLERNDRNMSLNEGRLECALTGVNAGRATEIMAAAVQQLSSKLNA